MPGFILSVSMWIFCKYLCLFCDFQVQQLIAELNEILAHETVDEHGLCKQKLLPQSLQLFELLPRAIQDQLMLERDPHGNVQVLYVEKRPLAR